jgi:hypothetical protein
MSRTIACLTVVTLVAVVACSKEPTTQATTTTGAGVLGNEAAIDQVMGATCDRQVACNDVGPGKTYVDRDSCVSEVRHDLDAAIRGARCARGVRSDRLADCVNEIKTQRCGDAVEAIVKSTACRKGKLCVD